MLQTCLPRIERVNDLQHFGLKKHSRVYCAKETVAFEATVVHWWSYHTHTQTHTHAHTQAHARATWDMLQTGHRLEIERHHCLSSQVVMQNFSLLFCSGLASQYYTSTQKHTCNQNQLATRTRLSQLSTTSSGKKQRPLEQCTYTSKQTANCPK